MMASPCSVRTGAVALTVSIVLGLIVDFSMLGNAARQARIATGRRQRRIVAGRARTPMTSAGPDNRMPHRVCVCNAGKGKTPTRASLNFDEHQGAARDSSVY